MSEEAASDEFINGLFEGTNFGPTTNNTIEGKRKQIAKTLTDLGNGYWSGHTAYFIVLNGGFIFDGPGGEAKDLTDRGLAFMDAMNIPVVKAVNYDISDDSRAWAKG